ncbi:MAG: type IX secretion system protein PorQ [Paludibacteraceae bacterium]|nr:type IX secretion system protein PorQ [Paludibacteraceae bacterium]
MTGRKNIVGKKLLLFLFSCVVLPFLANAEAGKGVYHFLNLPYDAKLAGLGGENVSLQAADVNMAHVNPALLSTDVHNKVSATYLNYIDDANAAALSYAYALDSLNYFGVGLFFLGYGELQGYDEFGQPTGDFSAGDLCLRMSYARYLGANIRLGVSLKPVYSHIEDYSSFGLAVDVGFNYYNKEKLFSVGLAARNYGVQCVKYYDSDNREILPFNLQVGFSKELAHAPFRFSVTYDRLNDWNLDYYRQVKRKDVVGEEPDSDKIKGGDMFFRHMIFGVDVLLGKNFYVEMAYNHRRKREFTLEESRGANGFSFGAGLKVYAFSLDLAYSLYAPAANAFTLTLTADLEKFRKK